MKRWMAGYNSTEHCLFTILAPSGATPQHSSTTKKAVWENSGRPACRSFVLTNKGGAEATITNYGGAVVAVKVPDRNGKTSRCGARLRYPRWLCER